jgi:hypothetical protein
MLRINLMLAFNTEDWIIVRSQLIKLMLCARMPLKVPAEVGYGGCEADTSERDELLRRQMAFDPRGILEPWRTRLCLF